MFTTEDLLCMCVCVSRGTLGLIYAIYILNSKYLEDLFISCIGFPDIYIYVCYYRCSSSVCKACFWGMCTDSISVRNNQVSCATRYNPSRVVGLTSS